MEETKELTLPEQARDQAKNYFRQGLNCTECVMQSFLDIHGSDLPPEVIALATVFGGGMGHTKNTCGAITGGVMALSAVIGRKHPLAKESKMCIRDSKRPVGPSSPAVNSLIFVIFCSTRAPFCSYRSLRPVIWQNSSSMDR